jgi:hypothetical protein
MRWCNTATGTGRVDQENTLTARCLHDSSQELVVKFLFEAKHAKQYWRILDLGLFDRCR